MPIFLNGRAHPRHLNTTHRPCSAQQKKVLQMWLMVELGLSRMAPTINKQMAANLTTVGCHCSQRMQ